MRVGDLLSAATECRVLVICSLTLFVFGELVGSGSREAFFLLRILGKTNAHIPGPHLWAGVRPRNGKASSSHGERAEDWGGWPLLGGRALGESWEGY